MAGYYPESIAGVRSLATALHMTPSIARFSAEPPDALEGAPPAMPTLDKPARLVAAAAKSYHTRGYSATTLAHVASLSGVPLGNIYYYFRSKDDLARAVVKARLGELRDMMAAAERGSDDPREQLSTYLSYFVDSAEDIARFGCPYGCLAQELERREGPLQGEGHALVHEQLEWMQSRYRALGHAPADAAVAAEELLGAWQGAMVLAQALHDPDRLHAAFARLTPRI